MAFAPAPTAAQGGSGRGRRLHLLGWPTATTRTSPSSPPCCPSRLRQDFCNLYAFCRIGRRPRRRGRRPRHLAPPARPLPHRDRADLYAGRPTSITFAALARPPWQKYRHPAPAVPGPDRRLRAGPAGRPLRHVRRRPRLLPPQRRPGRPAGPVRLRLPRRVPARHLSDCTCTSPCSWPTSGRTCGGTSSTATGSTCRGRRWTASASPSGSCGTGPVTDGYRAAIRFECDRASAHARRRARGCCQCWTRRLPGAGQRCSGQGGRAILDAIRRQGYDTLTRRPTVGQVVQGTAGAAGDRRAAAADRRAGSTGAGRPAAPARGPATAPVTETSGESSAEVA